MTYGGGEHQMGIPLIPAPAALCALMIGVMIGVMIGRKKSMMHGMGPGMMHGMGSGMRCGGDVWGDRAARKQMMGEGFGHHHHGDAMPACGCGHDSSAEGERVADE
jgi:hypothetical protein